MATNDWYYGENGTDWNYGGTDWHYGVVVTETVTPRLMTFFEAPRNRVTTPSEADDNDTSTWTTQTTIVMDIRDAANAATRFDHIFLKCAGVTSYEISVDGNSHGTRVLPFYRRFMNVEPALADIATTRNGWQYDLNALSSEIAGSEVRIVLTGTDVKVAAVLILKASVIVNRKYSEISHSKVDIDSVLHESEKGDIERTIISGKDRFRWRTNGELEFTTVDENYELFIDWINDHPNCVVAQDSRYPWRTYRATFTETSHNAPYIFESFEGGNTVKFQLIENRRIGLNPLPAMSTFNDSDDLLQYLFFNDCVHLKNSRVTAADGSLVTEASDNDFETYTTERMLAFNIASGTDPTQVTHIFLKGTGITAYQVQTEVAGIWVTQETVTPTMKAYRGWENSLSKLGSAVTAMQVRLVFSGTSLKISEVMLLEHAGGLPMVRNVLPIKSDRMGALIQTEDGEFERVRIEESSRPKWQLDFSTVFKFSNVHALEDYLDWINVNENFVFAERPAVKPWHCYPATFLNDEFNVRYLTKTVQIGDIVTGQVAER